MRLKGIVGLIIGIILTSAANAMEYAYNYRAYLGMDLQYSFFTGKNYRPLQLSGTAFGTTSSFGTLNINKGQLKTNNESYSLYWGFNLSSIGFEFGYTKFSKIIYPYFAAPVLPDSATNVSNFYLRQKGNNIYLDLLMYCQINPKHVVKGIIGIGALKTYVDFFFNSEDPPTEGVYFNISERNTRIGPRLGIGWQFNLNRCWSTDMTYKYQLGNAFYKDMHTLALALKYYFL